MATVMHFVALLLIMAVHPERLAQMETEEFQKALATDTEEEVLSIGAQEEVVTMPGHAALQEVHNSRTTDNASEAGPWASSPPWASSGLKVKLWTWNAGVEYKSEMQNSYHQIFSETAEDVDLIVTCHQEADYATWNPLLMDATMRTTNASVTPEASKGWKTILHGMHMGGTKPPHLNAQIMRVFLRDRSTYSLHSQDPKKNGEPAAAHSSAKKALGLFQNQKDTSPTLTVMTEPATGAGEMIMQATARTHSTDDKGKGGVSAELSWSAGSTSTQYRAAFLCAHLDSKSDDERSKGLADMMLDFKVGGDESSLTAEQKLIQNQARKAVTDQLQGPENYCAIWDEAITQHNKACPFDGKVVPAVAQESYDAFIIFGDLNYRLSKQALTDEGGDHRSLAKKILTTEGRMELAKYDPLNHDASGKVPARLIDITPNGFGFQCNQPQAEWFPSYKRTGMECASLTSQDGQPGSWDNSLNAINCYGEQAEDGHMEIAVHKNDVDLQLGWLDRVCYRTIQGEAEQKAKGLSRLEITLLENKAWITTPGMANKKEGSDHMPVESIMLLKPRSSADDFLA